MQREAERRGTRHELKTALFPDGEKALITDNSKFPHPLSLNQSHPSMLALSTAAQQQSSTQMAPRSSSPAACTQKARRRGDFLKTHLKALVLQMTTLRSCSPRCSKSTCFQQSIGLPHHRCCRLLTAPWSNILYIFYLFSSFRRKKSPQIIIIQLALYSSGREGVTLMNSVGHPVQSQAFLLLLPVSPVAGEARWNSL